MRVTGIFQQSGAAEPSLRGVMNRYVAPRGVLPDNIKRATAYVAFDVKAGAFRTTNEKIPLVDPTN
jgi:hypothetical protein